jgi:hypothetical protein
MVIAPKPFVGDPAYDVTQHLFNCQMRLQADPQALIRRVADAAKLETERVRLWTFARAAADPRATGTILCFTLPDSWLAAGSDCRGIFSWVFQEDAGRAQQPDLSRAPSQSRAIRQSWPTLPRSDFGTIGSSDRWFARDGSRVTAQTRGKSLPTRLGYSTGYGPSANPLA